MWKITNENTLVGRSQAGSHMCAHSFDEFTNIQNV